VFSRFNALPACDGWTDGQTDGQTVAHNSYRALHALNMNHAIKKTRIFIDKYTLQLLTATN